MEETDTGKRKKPLDIDWASAFDSQDEEPPAILVVSSEKPESNQQQQKRDSKEESTKFRAELQQQIAEHTTDRELNDLIRRQVGLLESHGPKLHDKGEKIRTYVQRLVEERERRKIRRLELDQDASACKKPTQSNTSSSNGSVNGFRQDPPSNSQCQSLFASRFSKKMEDSGGRMVDAFNKELSYMGRCNHEKKKPNGTSSTKQRHRTRQSPFRCPSSHSADSNHQGLSNSDRNGRSSSGCSLRQLGGIFSRHFDKKRDASQLLPLNHKRPKKEQTVVFVDEEDSQLIEAEYQTYKLAERLKESRIYYPSRDDPESIEIQYSDIKCLAPATFVTSTIMNFYIRYLQKAASPTELVRCDYHFFNTYFYKKLQEAVSCKGNDKDASFAKFRRWWKGVNIFQKAYILLPIHEDLHWSLAIICIPAKEDESGPIILHLDSLGFHNSRAIFDNIRSLIKEEWRYLNQEVIHPDVPIAERIWTHLPRRIEDKRIAVPQQKNDYDCGLFVLFFMERFIVEHPERLKMKDLAMFGKQWFKPEEASCLRGKIQKLLIEEFQKAHGS